MRVQLVLQAAGAILAIILGVVFFIYLPHDPGDVTTDAFFVGVGVLLLRSSYHAYHRPISTSNPKTSIKKEQGRKQKKKQNRTPME